MLKGVPAVALAGALTCNRLAAAGLMVMPVWLLVIVLLTVSVAVIDWVPAVFRVAVKVPTPLLRAVGLLNGDRSSS